MKRSVMRALLGAAALFSLLSAHSSANADQSLNSTVFARRSAATECWNQVPAYGTDNVVVFDGHRTPRVANKLSMVPYPFADLQLPDLPVVWNDTVLRFIDFFTKEARGRSVMVSWLKRKSRYEALIKSELERMHLPTALIYVAMIESGYDPKATSPVGAAGIWQFMPQLATVYGLALNHWIDRRRAPERQTLAALHYLQALFERFESWPLALAAYNAGDNAVLSAIQRYNTNDYWTLCQLEAGLPWSTSLYVPKILAAAIVGENLAYFGFDESTIAPLPSYNYATVTVPQSLTVAQIARVADVEEAIVSELNPDLRRNRTPPGEAFAIRLLRTSRKPLSTIASRSLATR